MSEPTESTEPTPTRDTSAWGRKNRVKHNVKSREKIKASQIVNLLQKHLLEDDKELSSSRVKIAEILLKKVLPDLQSMDGDLLLQMLGQENLDPKALAQSVGSALATNPSILLDILRQDESARVSVIAAIDQLKREFPAPVPAIELPAPTATQ